MYEELVNEIIEGRRLGKEDDLTFLIDGDLESLCQGADKIRKELCGNQVDLCTIINGRAGRCSENCRFCAQSSHHHTGAEEYDVMDVDSFVKACHVNEENGAHRFSIVTAGRTLVGKEFDQVVEAYKRMHEECKGIELCASHGLLTKEQFEILRKVGVTRCHANIETSRRYFPSICTTHTFEDKLACIRAAKEAGLEVCSGGIVGMGETWEDRLDMALTLAELEVDSIPLNALMPIPGTPFENLKQLTEEELLRVIAMFRFINPSTSIRLAAGRKLMKENGKKAFFSGANATITGDMLTTSGNNTKQDKQMLVASGHKLYFYNNPSRDDASLRMEIDFLIAKSKITSKHNISPIEVKSGGKYTLTSLKKCREKYTEQLDTLYVLHKNDLKVEEGIVYLPLYMTPLL